MSAGHGLLLIGEVYVDFTMPRAGADAKLRLGGIVHAARGLWAIDASFAVAAICPGYLVDQARAYLECLGCNQFIWLAEVKGAPNVMAVGDPTELADQAYQDILRVEKSVAFCGDASALGIFGKIVPWRRRKQCSDWLSPTLFGTAGIRVFEPRIFPSLSRC